MTDITNIILNDQYLIVLGVSIFFTGLSVMILLDKKSQVSMTKTASLVITVIAWFVSGAVHVGVSPSTSPLFAIGYLWVGIGIIFLIFLIVDGILAWKEIERKKWGDGY